MKFLSKLSIVFVVLSSVFLISCDRIENPVVIHDTSLDWSLYPNDTTVTPYPWPIWVENTNTLRNVLLEDYTGHTCTNCPPAAVIAKGIENANTNRVFVMSVHASTTGGFQEPELPELPLDHRTEAGNEYATVFNIIANPLGVLNRRANNSGDYYSFSSDWNSIIASELSKTLDINIQVQYNYYPATNGLFLHTETEVLNEVTEDYDIISCLIRNDLEAPQKDVGGVLVEEYDHHSVLTDNINGIWGTPIINGGESAGTKIYNDFTYQIQDATNDTSFNIENLSIITFISNRNTYEVMQVIKTNLQ